MTLPIALAAFDRGAALDSNLAVPFAQAWKSKIRGAIQAASSRPWPGPWGRIESGKNLPSGPTYAAVQVAAKQGAEATDGLVSFVLEGWSFTGAEATTRDIAAGAADSLSLRYDTPPCRLNRCRPSIPSRPRMPASPERCRFWS